MRYRIGGVMKKSYLIVASILLSVSTMQAFALSGAEEGLRIAKESDKRETGFVDNVANVVMTLRDKNGKESVRQMRSWTLEGTKDGDKSLVMFLKPRDVQGTAMLTHSHKTGGDDQWMYLPAIKRVKRISSANKSGSFMGSEFTYEDLGSPEVEKYKYTYLKDSDCGNGRQCYINQRESVDGSSQYSKQEVYTDKETYRPEKIKFYDRKGDLLKILTFSDYKQYNGKYWRAGTMNMENVQTGKSTELTWTEFQFNKGLKKRRFSSKGLKNIR